MILADQTRQITKQQGAIEQKLFLFWVRRGAPLFHLLNLGSGPLLAPIYFPTATRLDATCAVHSFLLSKSFARACLTPWLLVCVPRLVTEATDWGPPLAAAAVKPKLTLQVVRDPRPIVISGPSGVGKGTLYNLLFQVRPPATCMQLRA